MKIADPYKELNILAFQDPQPGDFWLERCYCPYFIIVSADQKNDSYTVLSCMGGPNSFNRKEELYAKKENNDGTWEFDYSKHMVVNFAWIKKAVKYDSIDGFVADVTRSERNNTIVKEWTEYQTDKLLRELKALGPVATMHMYRTLGYQKEEA
jgi:agmatine/peptidylarginine deiminase